MTYRPPLLAALFLAVWISASAGQADNLLIDGGFETGADSATFDAAWNKFGQVYHEPITPRSGVWTAKLFGNFRNEDNYSGISQDVVAAAGRSYLAEVYMRHNANDQLAGQNEAFIQLEFLDAQGEVLTQYRSETITAATDTDRFERYATGPVPAPHGTVTVRFQIVFHQTTDVQPGAVFCDEASLSIAAP